MNQLKQELNKLWNWTGFTVDDYKSGLVPIRIKQADWTNNYPDWDLFLVEIENTMLDLNKEWDENLAELLVIASSIDNGEVFNLCLEGLKDFNKFIDACSASKLPDAKIKITERIIGLIGN